MSPLQAQSTTFPQSQFTEELNSELFWSDSVIGSAFHEDPFRLFEGAATTFDHPPAPLNDHFLPSFEDYLLGPPPPRSGDGGHAEFAEFTANLSNLSLYPAPDDPSFLAAYQSTHWGSFPDDCSSCVPAGITATYEPPPPAPVTTFNRTFPTPFAHSATAPVDPSTMTVYAPCFNHFPHVSLSDGPTIALSPPASPSASPQSSDSPEPEGNVDYIPPSDDDEDYRPTQSTSYQGQSEFKATSKSKLPSYTSCPSSHSISEPEKNNTSLRKAKRSHPYNRNAPPRNLQCASPVLYAHKRSDFRCPVIGCDHIQKNRRVPDLKRHILTHGRLVEPEKWICCGVEMDRAHLYGKGIKQEMTDEERIKAGVHELKGRLMIGGCMQTFSRKDALKRHVDNSKGRCLRPSGSC